MPRGNERPAVLDRARAHYAAHEWRDAFDAFRAGAEQAPLDVDDLEALTWCAALIGRDEEFFEALDQLYHLHKASDAPTRAAFYAFWIGFRSMSLGEIARATGWFGRAQRLVERVDTPCVEEGYLLLPLSVRHLRERDFEAAALTAAAAATIGESFDDADLVALARDLEGRALIRSGQVDRGLALFDEGMLAATCGELSPLITGLLLCSVISSCKRVFAWERAREWTAALATWCDEQPDLVTFRGACQVHRSEVLQLAGRWAEALVQVERAVVEQEDIDREAAAAGRYLQGELHRLRGEFDNADAALAHAARLGREPQPGLALLRMAQGRADVAWSGIQRALAEQLDPLVRAQLLPAAVEIALAVDDSVAAIAYCDELEEAARNCHSASLEGIVAFARGLTHLAANDAQAALGPLRHAHFSWQHIGAPYEEARVQVALARACDALGDAEGAARALSAARETFARLGAASDLAALDLAALDAAQTPRDQTDALSPRELQVLRLVATGMTNRAIAAELALSDKTIERHVSNIFTKINVRTRTAAAAYAYEDGLIGQKKPGDG